MLLTPQVIIDIMNELTGLTGVTVADLPAEFQVATSDVIMHDVHIPLVIEDVPFIELPQEMMDVMAAPLVPELVDQEDDDSSSKASVESMSEDLNEMEAFNMLLNEESNENEKAENMMWPPLRRSNRSNKGVKKYDDNYEWSLLNLSIGDVIRKFGDVTSEACKSELIQLLIEKKH